MAESANCDIFPEDIIETILTKLPVKSLCRFKCVSKPWLSLISSKRFVKNHLRTYSPNFPRILTYHKMQHISPHSLSSERFPESETVPEIDIPEDLIRNVIGSCNGLVLILVGEEYHRFKNDLVIWNPSTGNHKQLPQPDIGEKEKIRYGTYGLGYDESKDDYVVLGIFFTYKGDFVFESHVKVYSCRSNSWKNIGQFLGGFPAYGIKCKFVGGKFYLPTCPVDSFDYFGPPVLFDIVSVDLENGVCAMVEDPDYYGDHIVAALSLEELGGRLCVVCSCKEDDPHTSCNDEWADVWIRKEDGVEASWTKIASVHNYFSDPWEKKSYFYKPVVMLPSGEIFLVLNHRLLIHDPKDSSTAVPVTSHLEDFEEADAYVESLVWPSEDENEGGETSDAEKESGETSDAKMRETSLVMQERIVTSLVILKDLKRLKLESLDWPSEDENEGGETSDASNERDETSDAEEESGETSDAEKDSDERD